MSHKIGLLLFVLLSTQALGQIELGRTHSFLSFTIHHLYYEIENWEFQTDSLVDEPIVILSPIEYDSATCELLGFCDENWIYLNSTIYELNTDSVYVQMSNYFLYQVRIVSLSESQIVFDYEFGRMRKGEYSVYYKERHLLSFTEVYYPKKVIGEVISRERFVE